MPAPLLKPADFGGIYFWGLNGLSQIGDFIGFGGRRLGSSGAFCHLRVLCFFEHCWSARSGAFRPNRRVKGAEEFI